MNLPVLVIAYSRPEGLSNILKVLQMNEIERIYIAIDGAKNRRDEVNQRSIDLIIAEFIHDTGKQIRVLRQKQNLGIAVAIIGAIDWFFEQEEMGVVLEDDLLIGKDFFEFASNSLQTYEQNDSVWMISGTQLFPNIQKAAENVWTNYPMIWGWGSWSKKWFKMRESILAKNKIPPSNRVSPRHSFWLTGANRVLTGKVDTWDLPLAFEFLNQNKFCILPPVNLITNVGNDAVSTNTNHESRGVGMKISSLDLSYSHLTKPNLAELAEYNYLLESQVFKIRRRHVLLPFYSALFDWVRFPKSRRKEKLLKRIVFFEF